MKLLTTLLLAAVVAFGVYAARRRIVFALKAGAVVYVVLLLGRLLFSAFSLADRWEDLVLPVIVLVLAWVILWWVSTSYAERRDQQKKLRRAARAERSAR
jgi:hypothetical protein